ncbi:hypothetical protein ACH9L7_18780 (plasmid) [Haloferax sp. S1W]|uniref:DUF7567 family protein n=1 Tax=Haloferax sp. S1W TaxID=3377110 RepID=UPI0037C8BAC4
MCRGQGNGPVRQGRSNNEPRSTPELQESRETRDREVVVLACFDIATSWHLYVNEKLRRNLSDGSAQLKNPNVAVWTGTAYYPLVRGLVTVRIPEGGTIRLEETEDGTQLSHAVWMDFPNNRRGWALKWVFTTALDGKAKLYDHTN